ncbi:MAG TPA: hypothetical protein VF278_23575, partial [Pirellulales bacterium]
GMPLVHASSQLFPDLPAGILLLFLAGRAMTTGARPPNLSWRDLLAAAALAWLPWLHVKYVAAALMAFGWQAVASRSRKSLLDAVALAGSLALLAWYNRFAFGKASGPYGPGDGLSPGLNSFIVFMGLHFDQAHGMFLQQPLWLLGLVGLAPMWRASRSTCLCWMLLYAAAILPNAMHPNWYGGGSFIGRFGATAVLLWAIPLGYAARSVFADHVRAAMVLSGASMALQLGLAYNWLNNGESLVNNSYRRDIWQPCVWSYNGFFPHAWRDFLPYWHPDVSFWRCPANHLALMAAAGLLACGICLPQRRRLAWGCLLGPSLAAMVLALTMHTTPASAICRGDALDQWGCVTGRNFQTARIAEQGVDSEGLMGAVYNFFARPGKYRIVLDYFAKGSEAPVGAVIWDDGRAATKLALLRGDDGVWQSVSLIDVAGDQTGKPMSIKIVYRGCGTLGIARLGVEPLR